jgi:uncharacterized protein YegL
MVDDDEFDHPRPVDDDEFNLFISETLPKPGPREGLSARPLHFFFIADCSGSMQADGRIQSLNQAIREALPHMKKAAEDNPQAQVLVRAIKFSSGAQWHVAQPTPISEFTWPDLSAGGTTDLGKALKMVAEELKIPPMSQRALPPLLILVTDGEPTDDWASGLKALLDQPWGRKAVRIAIAIGNDANLEVLQKFIGHPELKPLQANNPECLVQYIKWASTQVVESIGRPASQAQTPGVASMHVPVPAPPPTAVEDPGDVW